jgi:signal transduction histidine kinase/CheY-like chemotaxis protein
VCLLFAGSLAATARGGPPAELPTAQTVRNLTAEQAAQRRPVRITGVVTHVDPRLRDFFVQDESAGVYVHPTALAADLAHGDRIELEGKTDAGGFAPCVTATGLKKLGRGPLPDPQPFNLSADDSRWLDSQWVLAWVVVRGASAGGGYTRLDVYSAHGSAAVLVPGEGHAAAARRMAGLSVSVRGVCVPSFRDRVVVGPPVIYTQHLPLTPLTPAQPVGGGPAPPRMIDHLLRFSPAPTPGARRVTIAGVVTATPTPGLLLMQDESGGAAVRLEAAAPGAAVGARVEATGLLQIEGRRITLGRATVRDLGPAELPAPAPAPLAELADGRWDGRFVRVEARVEDVRPAGGWLIVTLVDGPARFDACLSGAPVGHGFEQLEVGSKVAVTGVPTAFHPAVRPPGGFGLVLQRGGSLVVLERPPAAPWWNAHRLGYLFAGFGAVCLLGGVWVLTLRARVRRATDEVRRQYEERERLEAQLRQAAKLEAVGRLAGGIAHDFNNLLTIIGGCAELLQYQVAAGSRAAGLAADILKASERAAGLTSQLLTFSHQKEVTLVPTDLNAVVAETAGLLARVIGPNVRLDTRLADGLPTVCGEAGLLHQVVMNLAVNAKDAMPDGGTLTIETGPAPDGRVRLAVADTGHGMTDEVKARIFEPFFTTKDVGQGTGLGLAVVYGAVQALGGRVGVDSGVGRGARFEIDLPTDGGPPAVPPAVAPPPAGRLGGVVVLLVEDNDLVRGLFAEGLVGEGATVLAASDGEHALKVLAGHPGRVDVLVTDVVMPGMGGRELADRVRADRPGVRVLFTSGYTADEVLRPGESPAPRPAFLQKPFALEHLTEAVRAALGGRPAPLG